MNSLRDNVKDAINECLDHDIGEAGEMADAIFNAMGIVEDDQDKTDVKITINPKVIVQVSGGMISIVECDKNVNVELRDYDIDTTSDEEFEEHGETVLIDENGDRYVTR